MGFIAGRVKGRGQVAAEGTGHGFTPGVVERLGGLADEVDLDGVGAEVGQEEGEVAFLELAARDEADAVADDAERGLGGGEGGALGVVAMSAAAGPRMGFAK